MKTIPRLATLATASLLVLAPGQTHALGVVSVGRTEAPAVREELFFVVYDEASHREHVLLAARLAPFAPRITLGLPVPGEASIEPVDGFDPGAALFSLIAPEERRMRSRPPAAPPPWPTRGATAKGRTTMALAGDVLFDAAWLKGYADAGFPLVAEISIEAPADGRLEVSTPGVRVTFATDRPRLPRREPKRAKAADEGTDELPAAATPFEVKATRVEPKDVGPSAEVVSRVLRARSGPLLDCYEVLLEQSPGAAPTLTVEATIRPKGETASLSAKAAETDETTKPFVACVMGALRKKQFPRTDEGWKLSAELSFRPPHAEVRRTHVVVLSASRRVWRSPPRSARKEHDFQVSSSEDLDRAFGQTLRRAMGLVDGQNVWLTHYLDRDERRALAEDAFFEPEAPPEAPAKAEKAAAAIDPMAKAAKEKASKGRLSRRAWSRFGALALAALTVAIGLWLGLVEDDRGRRRS